MISSYRIKILLIIAFCSVYSFLYARSNVYPSGSKPAGMGNAFVSQYDVFSVYHNQAGLANLERTSISFFYENQFLVSEMSSRAGMLTFHTGSGNFAVQYNSFGPPQWRESNTGISYARYLSKRLSAGLQLSHFGTRLPEVNRSISTLSFELGSIYQLTNNTFLGVHIANPYSPNITTTSYSESIPWRITIGGHTEFTNEFTFAYQLKAVKSSIPTIQLGAEWEAAENIFLRGGVNTGPARIFAGFGYVSNFLTVDAAFSYHQFLGYTPSVSLIFSFF